MRKKIAIVGTQGLPAKYGGFETLTNYLVAYLANEYIVTVYCEKTPKSKKIREYNGAKLKYFPFRANGWQSLIYDFFTIFHAYFTSKNIIVLGFSGAFAFPFNKIFKRNIIFNIGGIEWLKVRGAKLTAKVEIKIKKYMEKLCVHNSNTIIIDNEAFEDYLNKKYKVKPVLAEYGGNHAQKITISETIREEYPFIDMPYDITISRAQEDMNIHLVIEAYKQIPNRKIVIISNWFISEYGKQLYEENKKNYPNIILIHAIYDLTVLNVLRSNCILYLHTHSLCGTAPSLVEAMSLKLPIVAFDVQTNRFTTEGKAVYFSDVNSLVKLIKNISKMKLNVIGDDMFDIAKRRYSWERIVSIYKNYVK